MRPGQRVLACLSRKAVASSRTTSFSSLRCVVRLVGKLCFFDNFRPHYGEFNDLCPKTFEHPSAPNSSSLRQDMLSFSCAGYLGHPFWKKQLESDLLVPFCLRERSGTGRIRESACISYVDTFL